jgi:small subunit ribosomal protein S10
MKQVRICVHSFDSQSLGKGCTKILHAINKLNVECAQCAHMPVNKRVYALLRSPHVHKKSIEHIETRTYKRVYTIHTSIHPMYIAIMCTSLRLYGVNIHLDYTYL